MGWTFVVLEVVKQAKERGGEIQALIFRRRIRFLRVFRFFFHFFGFLGFFVPRKQQKNIQLGKNHYFFLFFHFFDWCEKKKGFVFLFSCANKTNELFDDNPKKGCDNYGKSYIILNSNNPKISGSIFDV